jgi:hypothetical protein
MNNVKRITQAYSQTPWRNQIQAMVSFLLGLVIVSIVAGVYLSVSAKAVQAGHDIRTMYSEIGEYEENIADLESQLAFLLSTSAMEDRAQQLGYRPAQADDMEYILVPGYSARREIVLGPPPGLQVVETTYISPNFSESLIDWLMKNVFSPTGILAEVRP